MLVMRRSRVRPAVGACQGMPLGALGDIRKAGSDADRVTRWLEEIPGAARFTGSGGICAGVR